MCFLAKTKNRQKPENRLHPQHLNESIKANVVHDERYSFYNVVLIRG